MTKPLGLVYIPQVNGLPGMEERHLAYLRREADRWDWRAAADKEDFARLLPDAEVALVWSFSAKLSDRAAKLRMLSTPSAGKELIRIAPRSGLEVRFGAFQGELMAETTLGLMLAFTRGIKDCIERKNRGWARAEVAQAMRPLRGSHAAILGFGHIGKWIGRLVKPFGVRITGVNRSDLTHPDYFEAGDAVAPLAELDSVLPDVDHLILALPGTTGTDRLVDAARLALLPRTAYVYNIGRGNALDLPALEAALKSGALAGAGLDVFPEEPLAEDAPIRDCPTAVVMPHVSAFAPNYMDLYVRELAPELRRIANNPRKLA